MFLPIELVDYILSFLQSDIYSLKNCTCGDPVLSKFAERYIYAHITLCDDPLRSRTTTSWTTHKLAQIPNNKPEIAKYIRSLTIYLKDYGNSPLITLASLLPTFPQLTSITINGNRKDSSWDQLPEKFRQEFPVFLRAQLRELCISSVSSFPLCSLDGCKNLRIVTLDLCGDLQYEGGSTKDRASPLLKHFAFRPCRGMSIDHLASWLQSHNLRSLKFTGAPEDVERSFREHLPPLLAASSHSLTNLCLDLKDKCEPEFHRMVTEPVEHNNGIIHFPLNLACLSHLEHITICGIFKQDADVTFPISGIMELVSTAAPSLKNVSLWLETDLLTYWHNLQRLSFTPLTAQCFSLSVVLSVFQHSSYDDKPRVFPWDYFRSRANCVKL